MFESSIKETKNALRKKQVSALELTKHSLTKLKDLNPKLNAFISDCEEQAILEAKNADACIAAGKEHILTGIPIAHKDIFCIDGTKTTCGSKILDNFIAPYTATVVKNMQQNGAINIGKTNMDEFAMGSSNETSYYGKVSNPWKMDCVPGGSSGGSAAAVAARIVCGATGTDTGGSIRQPAAFCGITGLKPTYGLVSRFGMIAFASSLDQAGPMAPSSEDCAYLLQGMAGHDKQDSTSAQKPNVDYLKNISASLEGLCFGVPKEFFSHDIPSDITKIIDTAIKQFEKLGVNFKEISLPSADIAIPTYYIIAPAECSSNLSRFDGIKYGFRAEKFDSLDDLYCKTRSQGFGSEVKRRILIGTYVLSSGFYDAYYLKARKIRGLITNEYLQAFKGVDAIFSPATPSVAFRHGELSDPISLYLSDIFTCGVNLAGLPAISFPAGISNGLPVGVQLIGKHFDEARLLNFAHKFQQETDWHLQTPSIVTENKG